MPRRKMQESRKFQFVLDHETASLLEEIKRWSGAEETTSLLKRGVKELHYRLSQHRQGRQLIAQPVKPGETIFDPLVSIVGRAGR